MQAHDLGTTSKFETIEDVLAAIDAIAVDYEGNCGATCEIAAEYVAAEKVIDHMMEQTGL